MWLFVLRLVAALALTTLSYALSARPQTGQPQAAGLDEFDIPIAEQGRPIPVTFGTVLLTGPNVVRAGDLRGASVEEQASKTCVGRPHAPRPASIPETFPRPPSCSLITVPFDVRLALCWFTSPFA